MTPLRFLLLAAALWVPEPAPPAQKAATPEELVAFRQNAQRTGDPKAGLSLYGGPNRALFEQGIKVCEAGMAFDKALDDKFGKDPSCKSSLALQAEPAKRVELKGKKDLGGGKVELTIWTVGETVVESREVAIRENGGWVLLAPVPFTCSTAMEEIRTVDGQEVKVQVMSPTVVPAESLAAARVALPRMREVLERAARDVAAGKHASRKAAVEAVDAEVAAAFDLAMGKIAGKGAPK